MHTYYSYIIYRSIVLALVYDSETPELLRVYIYTDNLCIFLMFESFYCALFLSLHPPMVPSCPHSSGSLRTYTTLLSIHGPRVP